MSTIVTRAGKGSALTHNEVDANFVNLNTDKLQSGNTAAALTITSATINGGTITGTALNGTLGATTPSTVAATTISASGVSTFAAGSAGAPAITTAGDTNTGIFFPAADTIAFAEGGTESMRINSAGNLVVGGTDASYGKFSVRNGYIYVNEDGVNTQQIYIRSNYISGVPAIQVATVHPLAFVAGNTEYMRITATGNVGIGTASPSQKLTAYNGSSRTLIRAASDLNFSGAYLGTATATNRGASLELLTHANSTDAGGWKQQVAVDVTGNYDLTFSYASPASTYAGLSYTERMRLNESGNLGLGVTPNTWYSAWKALQGGTSFAIASAGQGMYNVNNAYLNSSVTWIYTTTGTASYTQQYGGAHYWYTAPSGTAGNAITWTQAMTLDASGNLLVGTTGTGFSNTNGVDFNRNGQVYFNHVSGSPTGLAYALFGLAASSIGSITQSGTTAVAYNTSSDYRLKENIAPMTGALETVAKLKPVTYNWKVDGSDGQGFIAHELQEVVPDCVTGKKDATEEQEYEISPAIPAVLDEEGNVVTEEVPAVMGTRTVPVYQGIDTSFLVATLTAAIQEQQAMIDELKAKVAALEAA
jgi:hypothetical protein